MLGLLLIAVLVLLVLGAAPTWQHSQGWGNTPVGVLLIILIIVMLLTYTGRI